MKLTYKVLAISTIIISPLLLTSTVTATSEDDLFDFLDSLADASTFGYTGNQQISIKENTDTTVTITSPVITDDLGTTIHDYTLQYSTQPSLDLIEQNKADQIKKKDYNFPNAKDTIDFVLTVGKEIEKNKTYYVSIVPKNAEGFPGDVSKEISFNLEELIANQKPTAQETKKETKTPKETKQEHATAPDMCAANISYVQDNNNIKVTRDAVDPSARLNIYIRHASERDFRKITTVKVSDESYTFVATRNGTHYLKLEPIDSNGKVFGKECVQTLRLQEFTATNIPVAPKNGPETTLLFIILGITLMGYLAYRRKQIG